jgi:hypothetical protein
MKIKFGGLAFEFAWLMLAADATVKVIKREETYKKFMILEYWMGLFCFVQNMENIKPRL